jgi:hypothetical protein
MLVAFHAQRGEMRRIHKAFPLFIFLQRGQEDGLSKGFEVFGHVIFPRFDRVPKAEIYLIKSGKGSSWQRLKKPTHESSKVRHESLVMSGGNPQLSIQGCPHFLSAPLVTTT